MKWIEINKSNIPENEVLAANFEKNTYGYKEKIIGYLSKNDNDFIDCENDNQLLENATHYVDINTFDL